MRRVTLLLSCVVATGFLMANQSRFFGTSDPPENVITPSTAPATDIGDPDAATSWDANSHGINSFRDDLAPFETRTRQLWDDQPGLIQE